jgi:hypothetical protein
MVRVWWVCTFAQRCYRCVICEVHGAGGSSGGSRLPHIILSYLKA